MPERQHAKQRERERAADPVGDARLRRRNRAARTRDARPVTPQTSDREKESDGAERVQIRERIWGEDGRGKASAKPPGDAKDQRRPA